MELFWSTRLRSKTRTFSYKQFCACALISKNILHSKFFWSVFSCIQFEYRKIRTRKKLRIRTLFHAVDVNDILNYRTNYNKDCWKACILIISFYEISVCYKLRFKTQLIFQVFFPTMSGIADISSPQTFSNDLADYFCKVSWKLKENNATSSTRSLSKHESH